MNDTDSIEILKYLHLEIVDVLFAGNKFPLSIEPTELPEGVVADVHFDPKEPEQITQMQTRTSHN